MPEEEEEEEEDEEDEEGEEEPLPEALWERAAGAKPEAEDDEENEEEGVVDGKRAAQRADPVPDRSAPVDKDADRAALI